MGWAVFGGCLEEGGSRCTLNWHPFFPDDLFQNNNIGKILRLCFKHSLSNSLRAMVNHFPNEFETFALPENQSDVILSTINETILHDIETIYFIVDSFSRIGKYTR